MIDAIIKEDFNDLNFRFKARYNPFNESGVAYPGEGTQLGWKSFKSRKALRKAILHEELHHRWWEKGIPSYHHSPNKYIKDEKFYEVLKRYFRMRGWKYNGME